MSEGLAIKRYYSWLQYFIQFIAQPSKGEKYYRVMDGFILGDLPQPGPSQSFRVCTDKKHLD